MATYRERLEQVMLDAEVSSTKADDAFQKAEAAYEAALVAMRCAEDAMHSAATAAATTRELAQVSPDADD